MERYRLMFVFRTKEIALLYCIGMDYLEGSMFCVSLFSPDDDIKLSHNTKHYPNDLIEYLKKEKCNIDKGFYDIRMWNMKLYKEDRR